MTIAGVSSEVLSTSVGAADRIAFDLDGKKGREFGICGQGQRQAGGHDAGSGVERNDLDVVVFDEEDEPTKEDLRWMIIVRVHIDKGFNTY